MDNRVSTHSRPKAAGSHISQYRKGRMFQHTAARRRLGIPQRQACIGSLFQHTAARRRLVGDYAGLGVSHQVSTHSRPKAAGLGQLSRLDP